uniref:Transmembrane protein n=1 Tax=Anopheles coluzzii TaxID=1518534 RepID=A0A8W7PTG3_ANOCL
MCKALSDEDDDDELLDELRRLLLVLDFFFWPAALPPDPEATFVTTVCRMRWAASCAFSFWIVSFFSCFSCARSITASSVRASCSSFCFRASCCCCLLLLLLLRAFSSSDRGSFLIVTVGILAASTAATTIAVATEPGLLSRNLSSSFPLADLAARTFGFTSTAGREAERRLAGEPDRSRRERSTELPEPVLSRRRRLLCSGDRERDRLSDRSRRERRGGPSSWLRDRRDR